jgi:general secretion pathway protein D
MKTFPLLAAARPFLLAAAFLLAAGLACAQQFGSSRSGRSSTTTYPSSTQMGSATVTFDQETRKLIVITDDETAQYVGQVITNVDHTPPQVLINVVFLEVTYRKGLDVGVEGSFSKGNIGGGVSNNITQGFGGLPGINSGAGVVQMIGGNYQATLRAIAEAGKLEVLSRPSVLARNNQQATITVGQQVPLITGTRYDNFGNQINSISYQSVGIILRVTPFITSAGMVEMIVSPEISNLSDQTVAISTGTNSVGAPVINTRSADTVVVTPDGQTVVIGGLMQNTKTSTTSKIPLLGDIPGLGALFRRKVTNEAKTELLIFLTPQIVRTPSELAAATRQERANGKITPEAFSKDEVDQMLHGAKPDQAPAVHK